MVRTNEQQYWNSNGQHHYLFDFSVRNASKHLHYESLHFLMSGHYSCLFNFTIFSPHLKLHIFPYFKSWFKFHNGEDSSNHSNSRPLHALETQLTIISIPASSIILTSQNPFFTLDFICSNQSTIHYRHEFAILHFFQRCKSLHKLL